MLPINLVVAYAFGSSEGLADGKWSRRLQYVYFAFTIFLLVRWHCQRVLKRKRVY